MNEPNNRPGQAGFDPFSSQRRLAEVEEKLGISGVAANKTLVRVDLNFRTDGNDITGDGTTDFPFRTMQPVVDRLPDLIKDPVLVHFGSGTYTLLELGQRGLGAPLVLIGDGAGGLNDDAFTVVKGSTLADAGTNANQVVDPDAPLGLDVFLDFTIEILTGPGAGQRRTIQEVLTTGEIIPARAFDVAPDSTSTYRIVRPAVFLESSENLEVISGLSGLDEAPRDGNPKGPLMLVNLQLKAATGSGLTAFNFISTHCILYGVEFFGVGSDDSLFYFSHCEVYSGEDDVFGSSGGAAAIPPSLGLTSTVDDWAGWGFTIPVPTAGSPDASIFGVGNSNLQGYFNAVSLFTQALSRFGITYLGGRLRGGLSLSGGGIMNMLNGLVDDTVAVGTFGLEGGFVMFGGELRSAGPLVDVVGHGRADIFSTATGTSTAGPAIRARFGALVTLFGAPALVGAVAGTAYEVDDGSTSAATFSGPSDALVTANGTSAIIRRA